MKQRIRLALIGLGHRGANMLRDVFLPMTDMDVEICALCDRYEDRVQAAGDRVEEKTGGRPLCTTNYREAIACPQVEAVVVMTSWEDHLPVAVAAMKAGKPTAMEVGGAYNVEDCWKLVDTYEETGTPLMLLENCCYGKTELMVLRMVQQGLFGEIVHCSGGYCHDLRGGIATCEKDRRYRQRNYLSRNTENYPTHELGPIAKVLNINNGNKMLTLSSVASKARGMQDYLQRAQDSDANLAGAVFNQGDVVTTTIRCANGETIVLTLDTTLPRYYDRCFTVRGTRGGYFGSNDSVFLDGKDNEDHECWEKHWGNSREYEETYLHPLWRGYEAKGGHGGMDWLVVRAFIESVKNGTHPPIDVYDAASWMCITALSEQSVAMGGMPVAVPDFTRGMYTCRRDLDDGPYMLHQGKE